MDAQPLVSVICLCYNQARFVREAINSVLTQTYSHVELIVVDDASTDKSAEIIREFQHENQSVTFLPLHENLGNCRAFNLAFKISKGSFIIDLAADDVLLPARIEEGIKDFFRVGPETGIHFSDAFIIDENGRISGTHYHRNGDGHIDEPVPEGEVYEALIKRYFINPATMMIKREVLEALDGYDETLSYEDFDFWIRSSREFQYCFHHAPLVKKRVVRNSLSNRQRHFRNSHQFSTYRVCEKIRALNRTGHEQHALRKRCRYEIVQCLLTMNWGLAWRFYRLMRLSK